MLRRFSRRIIVLFIVGILFVYYHLGQGVLAVRKPTAEALHQVDDSQPDTDSESLVYKIRNQEIVYNIGRRRCVHGLSVFEFCWCKSRILSKALRGSRRVTINKDIRSSKSSYWFGVSEYLYYDVIDSNYCLDYLPFHGGEMGIKGITEISGHGSEDSYQVDGIYLKLRNITRTSILDEVFVGKVNVLLGKDCAEPRNDWIMDNNWLIHNGKIPSYLTYRKMSLKDPPKKPTLRVPYDGKFKIVQLADLHFGVGEGICRDEHPRTDNCKADPKTLKFIEEVLDIEVPDMVVFTGDQLMGDRCKQDSETAMLKVVAPVIKRGIPYAMVWGNHDDEGSMSRLELSNYVSQLPYSLFEIGPGNDGHDRFGYGNYVLNVLDNDKKPSIALYFLDSHKYSLNPKAYAGYDWIKEEQWAFIEKYHDDKFSKNDLKLSMAFFHIPLPEYNPSTHEKSDGLYKGEAKESVTAPKYNSNGAEVLRKIGVTAVSVGHDHCNDYCLNNRFPSTEDYMWLCYGGAAGEGGYAGYGGTERRIRIFELDSKNRKITTWKRLHSSPDQTFDKQSIVAHDYIGTV